MKTKILVCVISLSLLLSGILIVAEGEATTGKGINGNHSLQEIHDWHDLDEVRDNLSSNYVLMDDLDKDSAGYEYYHTQMEDYYEVQEDAGYDETWDEGDAIDIHFDEENYDSVLSVKDGEGNLIEHTIQDDYIRIDEDTGDRYVYVTYENAVVGWDPIGNYHWDEDVEFMGTLDGNGHYISDLYINRPETEYVGLFGYTDGAEVTYVRLVEADVRGRENVGALIGHNNYGTVENSYATGNVSGDEKVGGLVGRNEEGTISHSYAISHVIGEDMVGGLVGWNSGSETILSKSYFTGNVTGENRVGGMVGNNYETIENSYFTGNVTGDEKVGGLVGYTHWSAKVYNSYSTGNVSGFSYVGGLIGDNDEGDVENSFWDIETSGQHESDGGTGKTTEEMKDVATYTDIETEGLEEPWDFVGDPNDDEGDDDIWDIDEDKKINDGYPFFDWEEEELKEYILTLDEIVGEGTIEVDGEEIRELPYEEIYEKGTEVELKALPTEGWKFDGWTGDNETIEDPTTEKTTIEMIDNYNITPEFTRDTCDLTIDSTEGGEVVHPGEDTFEYEYGKIVNLEASADEGSEFVRWIGEIDQIENPDSAETTIEMLDNYSITAEFRAVERAHYEVEIIDYDKNVYEGDTVSIEFAVENTGDVEGTQDIVFRVDGNDVDSKDMTIGAGDNDTGEFTWEAEEAGNYDIEVVSDYTSDSVMVTVEEDEIDMMMIVSIILIIMIVLTIIGYMMKGREREKIEKEEESTIEEESGEEESVEEVEETEKDMFEE